ncbi:hypothetical protein [Modestobacter sp. URMC 112]
MTHATAALRPRTDRRRGRAVALLALVTSVLAASLLLPATAAHAWVDKSGVRTVTSQTAPLAPGESAWVAVVWTADQTVTDWSTTVTAPAGVAVTYPTTRGGADTSLYGSATLVGTTRDFTAFKLAVPHGQGASFPVTVTTTYTLCGDNGQCKNQGDGNDDRTGTTSATVLVPVEPAVGAPFTQDTTQVAIAGSSDTFQQIGFTGGRTDLADFAVRVGALPAGLQVAYAGDGPASRLNGGSSLLGRHADHVGIRFVATDLPPGRYTIPLTISYTAAAPVTTNGTVTLVVS